MIKSRKSRAWIVVFSLAVFGVAVFVAGFATTAERRFSTSPGGAYFATVNYRCYETLLPRRPGDGSGMPGFVSIYSSDGAFCGRTKVPILWMADELKWSSNTAEIRLVAEWDLVKRTVNNESE